VAALADDQREALTQVIIDYAFHDSWRCYSSRYPDECRCGLNEALVAAGLDPENWRKALS
jgi:hypothetical protein